ncbi:DUF975 family protein [Streptococcus merionis]|uniref:DUF975 family protein n=1 Tax=Streptococcus merionis TaxID=400065 RepID=UPI0026EC65A2|nr:DUF975 family protein [Streptococcus merionis]
MENYDIREKAREALANLKGKYLLFLIPILVQILRFVIQYTLNDRTTSLGTSPEEITAALEASTSTLTVSFFSGQIFNLILNILMAFITLGALWTMLEVIRHRKTEVSFKDSLKTFSEGHFGKVFVTFLLKNLYLLLWSLPAILGLFSFVVGATLIAFDYISQGRISSYSEIAGWMMLGGFVVMLLGLIPLIIKSYSYAMTEFILFDQIENGSYTSANACITASKHLMKGYKFQLFLLQFSFIGWWLLVLVTFGLAGFYVIPYFHTAQTVFYNELTKHLQIEF